MKLEKFVFLSRWVTIQFLLQDKKIRNRILVEN